MDLSPPSQICCFGSYLRHFKKIDFALPFQLKLLLRPLWLRLGPLWLIRPLWPNQGHVSGTFLPEHVEASSPCSWSAVVSSCNCLVFDRCHSCCCATGRSFKKWRPVDKSTFTCGFANEWKRFVQNEPSFPQKIHHFWTRIPFRWNYGVRFSSWISSKLTWHFFFSKEMRALVTFTGASGPFTHNWKFGWLSNWTNHSSSKIRKTRTQAKASKGPSHVAAFRKTEGTFDFCDSCGLALQFQIFRIFRTFLFFWTCHHKPTKPCCLQIVLSASKKHPPFFADIESGTITLPRLWRQLTTFVSHRKNRDAIRHSR